MALETQDMRPKGTQVSGNQQARIRPREALAQRFPSALLLFFLLIGGLPCATLFGCGCPCPAMEASGITKVLAQAACCEASADVTLILSLPTEPQREVAALPIASAENPGASAAPVLGELPRLSLTAERLYDPPPLILLLCTLLN